MRFHAKAGLSSPFFFALVVLLGLVMPSFAAAQHPIGSFRAAPSAPVSHAAPARVHTGNHTNGTHAGKATSSAAAGSRAGANEFGVESFSASNSSTSDFGVTGFATIGLGSDPLSVQQILNPYPGFGFDFEHLTAIHRDDDIKALIDPATQVRLAQQNRRPRKSPQTGGGFIFLTGGGAYALPGDANSDGNADQDAEAAADQPGQQDPPGQRLQNEPQRPVSIVQQASEPSAESNEAAAAEEEAESLPDEGEFTLVLRNGREIEAVAFTRFADKIIYITTTGGRRTLALSEIDSDATVRMNQERGTPLQLPL